MNQLTKITLAWELFEQAVPKAHIADQLGVTRETVHWTPWLILLPGWPDHTRKMSKVILKVSTDHLEKNVWVGVNTNKMIFQT